MFLMYDSVDLSQVPANPHAVGCYRNGRFANEGEARRRFPHAYIVPISVRGIVPCMAYDVERGDYDPSQVAELFSAAHVAGIWRPIFYASLDNGMPEVEKNLHGAGIPRFAWRKWSAHYDFRTTFDGDEDAKQFSDKALGRNLDESICRDGFFPPIHHPAPVPKPPPAPAPDEERIEYSHAFNAGFVAGFNVGYRRG